jgi:aminoglycoside/choline kinase family phosphotransferase
MGLRAARRTLAALNQFLDQSGYGAARRRAMQGDASTPSYERLHLGRRTAILMNCPRRPDGPPVRERQVLSAIAHLAEDVKPFVALAEACANADFQRRKSTLPISTKASS